MRRLALFTALLFILITFSGCLDANITAKPKTDGSDESGVSSEPVDGGENEPDYTVVPSQDESPSPSPSPEPSEPPKEVDPMVTRADEIIAGMTGDELICQLFVVRPETLTGVETATMAGETTKSALETYPVGGLVYLGQNIVGAEQVKTMLANTQSYSKLGLILCLDEEGGRVSRLKELIENDLSPMFDYREQGRETAFTNALTIGDYIKSFGFNADLAPVADVWYQSENTVIGDRAYSDSFTQAAELVSAAVDGFKSSGVIATLKHFPGHGGTVEDSHETTAVLDKTLESLMAEDFLPFTSGIDAGADMVMLGHILAPQIDPDEPATFSYELTTGVLRNILGFEGVIITDSLTMGAVSELGSGEVAVKALTAGADLLLDPSDLPAAVQGIRDAIATGELSYERIIESVRRVLVMKLNNGIIS